MFYVVRTLISNYDYGDYETAKKIFDMYRKQMTQDNLEQGWFVEVLHIQEKEYFEVKYKESWTLEATRIHLYMLEKDTNKIIDF